MYRTKNIQELIFRQCNSICLYILWKSIFNCNLIITYCSIFSHQYHAQSLCLEDILRVILDFLSLCIFDRTFLVIAVFQNFCTKFNSFYKIAEKHQSCFVLTNFTCALLNPLYIYVDIVISKVCSCTHIATLSFMIFTYLFSHIMYA